MYFADKLGLECMLCLCVDIWSIWVNGSETTAYTAKDNDVIVADISHKVTFTRWMFKGIVS
jgi:hypothetical protein